jgi:hypothetical protein
VFPILWAIGGRPVQKYRALPIHARRSRFFMDAHKAGNPHVMERIYELTERGIFFHNYFCRFPANHAINIETSGAR